MAPESAAEADQSQPYQEPVIGINGRRTIPCNVRFNQGHLGRLDRSFKLRPKTQQRKDDARGHPSGRAEQSADSSGGFLSAKALEDRAELPSASTPDTKMIVPASEDAHLQQSAELQLTTTPEQQSNQP